MIKGIKASSLPLISQPTSLSPSNGRLPTVVSEAQQEVYDAI
jgi:hypothetical protein